MPTNEHGSILLVDDDIDLCELLRDGLGTRGFEVDAVNDSRLVPDRISTRDYDVVLSDINLGSGFSGLELCKMVSEQRPDVPVVVLTAFGNMETAVQAIRSGAYDFITKPVSLDALQLTVGRAIRHHRLRCEVKRLTQAVEGARRVDGFIGESPPMRKVYDLVSQVAEADTTVLVTGESGTGKELVARAIHERSARKDGQLVAINCAAMPASLLESELFGHVKGAFTDAKVSRQGLFVKATNGTLFLDEIGEMPMEMQAKLLRVLQERRARPVGGDTEIPFDTRIIAATNRDLESRVEEGSFREDLYYRINVVRIHVPPLRARGNDILLLAQVFLEAAAKRTEKQVAGISPEAARKLLEYEWPGNVRELENAVERAVALTRHRELTLADLPDRVRSYHSSQLVIGGDDPGDLPTLAEVEWRYIHRVLKAVGGNKTQAAHVLGLDRRTLYRRLEKFERQQEQVRHAS